LPEGLHAFKMSTANVLLRSFGVFCRCYQHCGLELIDSIDGG